MQTVLLSATPSHPGDDLRECLARAGYAVRTHALGSTPPADFAAVAVVAIEVGERPEVAAAQTRRWRTELGDELIPIVWVLPTMNVVATSQGLVAGADAVLARPFDA